jgi:hypothetical protein
MINKKIVIPRKFSKSTPENKPLKFFSPRLVVIQVNQPIKFINQDENIHYLESVNLQGNPDRFFDTGEIKSGRTVVIRLTNFKKIIPFSCKFHPLERGVILMVDKERRDMTDTERLRLLTSSGESEQEFWNLVKEIDDSIG